MLQYGAVGALCILLIYLLIRQFNHTDIMSKRLEQVVGNNTIALTRFYEIAKKCKR